MQQTEPHRFFQPKPHLFSHVFVYFSFYLSNVWNQTFTFVVCKIHLLPYGNSSPIKFIYQKGKGPLANIIVPLVRIVNTLFCLLKMKEFGIYVYCQKHFWFLFTNIYLKILNLRFFYITSYKTTHMNLTAETVEINLSDVLNQRNLFVWSINGLYSNSLKGKNVTSTKSTKINKIHTS